MDFFLFGSRATGKAKADSDWDVLVKSHATVNCGSTAYEMLSALLDKVGDVEKIKLGIANALNIPASDEIHLFIEAEFIFSNGNRRTDNLCPDDYDSAPAIGHNIQFQIN